MISAENLHDENNNNNKIMDINTCINDKNKLLLPYAMLFHVSPKKYLN